ncbi:MAG: sigma-70 family RNA polymerase sigma factor [Verrucomicrobiales bacterium]|jgi:RNA polymerase sigma factor (sigma-70 family)|nr:sigma-70 family RNA polymerase sigma factor [Verrucomicrobiales bacterium]
MSAASLQAMEVSPRELVESAQADFEGPLTGYAAGLLGGDWDRARDVVQDTFIKLHRQDPEMIRGKLKSWLYTVCRNRSIDVLRKENPMLTSSGEAFENLNDSEPDPSSAMQQKERFEEVLKFLDRLPDNQREVIRLKFQGDLSYKEISEVTGLSVSNVGFLIHTGIKRLRSLMGVELS